MGSESWNDLVADKRRRQAEAIPKEWLISAPPSSQLDVISQPETCGLLTDNELLITNAEVDVLLDKLATGQWSSVEVTTAFYKRAIVSQQLASIFSLLFVACIHHCACRSTVLQKSSSTGHLHVRKNWTTTSNVRERLSGPSMAYLSLAKTSFACRGSRP